LELSLQGTAPFFCATQRGAAVNEDFLDFIEGSRLSSLKLKFVEKIIDYFVEDGFG